MSNADAVEERAAAIRDYLRNDHADSKLVAKYAKVAARWEELRFAQRKGLTRPQDDDRLRELSRALQDLTARLGLGSTLTDANGFLPRDPARIICNDWLDHATTYFA